MLTPASLNVLPWLCCCLVAGDAGLSPPDPCGEEQKPRLGLAQLLRVAASFENTRVAAVDERPVTCLSFPWVFLGVALRLGTGTSSWKMRGISSS